MAHNTTEADMPMLELPGETRFTIETISPTADTAITGVTISELVLYGQALGDGGLIDKDLVPILSAEEVEGLND